MSRDTLANHLSSLMWQLVTISWTPSTLLSQECQKILWMAHQNPKLTFYLITSIRSNYEKPTFESKHGSGVIPDSSTIKKVEQNLLDIANGLLELL